MPQVSGETMSMGACVPSPQGSPGRDRRTGDVLPGRVQVVRHCLAASAASFLDQARACRPCAPRGNLRSCDVLRSNRDRSPPRQFSDFRRPRRAALQALSASASKTGISYSSSSRRKSKGRDLMVSVAAPSPLIRIRIDAFVRLAKRRRASAGTAHWRQGSSPLSC
jgi:hypothetical protein